MPIQVLAVFCGDYLPYEPVASRQTFLRKLETAAYQERCDRDVSTPRVNDFYSYDELIALRWADLNIIAVRVPPVGGTNARSQYPNPVSAALFWGSLGVAYFMAMAVTENCLD